MVVRPLLASIKLTPKSLTSPVVSRFCRNTDAQLLLYQARCLHHEQNNAGAQRLLLQALHLAPHDQVLRFDIALQVQVQALTKYRP